MFNVFAGNAHKEYHNSKNSKWDNIVISPNYYFIKATADAQELASAGSTQEVIDTLHLQATGDIPKIKFFECRFDGVSAEWSQNLKWKFFLSYLACSSQRYDLRNTFPIKSSVSKAGVEYVLAVHKTKSIVWKTSFPASFTEMVQQLQAKSGNRNALLFLEALSAKQEQDWHNQIFAEIQKLWGSNIANILLTKNSVQIDSKLYSIYKKKLPSQYNNYSIEQLLGLFNFVPDEKNIQTEIVQRFYALGMKKCASRFERFKYSVEKSKTNGYIDTTKKIQQGNNAVVAPYKPVAAATVPAAEPAAKENTPDINFVNLL